MNKNIITPHLRFKEFTEPWESKKLGEVLEIATRINTDNEFDKNSVLSVSDEFGIINQIEFQGRSFAADDVSNYKKVYSGDIIYTRSPLSAKPFGIIKKVDKEEGILSPLYIVNTPKDNNDSNFIYYRFDSPERTNNYLLPLVRKGAKNTMNISNEEWLSGNIVVAPSGKEQQKIGNFFLKIDEIIVLHEKKLDKLKKIKIAYLNEMFPKNGETVPKRRFSGFVGDWKMHKLGDYVDIISGDAPSKFEDGNELYVKVDDLNYNLKYVTDSQSKVAIHKSIKKALKGSVVFPKRGAAIMTNKVRILAKDSYMDTNMMALYSNKIDSEFLYNIISKEGLYKIADTSTIPQINNKHIEPYEVMLPELEEQQKISSFFCKLDNQISSYQKELNKLKRLKSAYLKEMFV